jgi:hypothetical protein
MVETRAGGETGIARVQHFAGEALWKAAADGLWSLPLADAAMATELGPNAPTLREFTRGDTGRTAPFGTLLTYRSGLRVMALKAGTEGTRWNFACRLEGEDRPRATHFYTGPWNNRNLFKALCHAIQTHFREGRAPYPVERTLLVTGALDAEAESRAKGGAAVETPHLALSYKPRDYRAMREMGATWKLITEDTTEPQGFDPGGPRPAGETGKLGNGREMG